MVLFPFETPGFEPTKERAQATGSNYGTTSADRNFVCTMATPGGISASRYDLNMQAQNAIPMSEKDALYEFSWGIYPRAVGGMHIVGM